jgi:hypothetical protein
VIVRARVWQLCAENFISKVFRYIHNEATYSDTFVQKKGSHRAWLSVLPAAGRIPDPCDCRS